MGIAWAKSQAWLVKATGDSAFALWWQGNGLVLGTRENRRRSLQRENALGMEEDGEVVDDGRSRGEKRSYVVCDLTPEN